MLREILSFLLYQWYFASCSFQGSSLPANIFLLWDIGISSSNPIYLSLFRCLCPCSYAWLSESSRMTHPLLLSTPCPLSSLRVTWAKRRNNQAIGEASLALSLRVIYMQSRVYYIKQCTYMLHIYCAGASCLHLPRGFVVYSFS